MLASESDFARFVLVFLCEGHYTSSLLTLSPTDDSTARQTKNASRRATVASPIEDPNDDVKRVERREGM
jgi:hypothetical protein